MTADEIRSITVGTMVPYFSGPRPAIEVDEVREVIVGADRGKVFRYVTIASDTGNATIGFIVKES